MSKIFYFMNDEIEWFYDCSFQIKTLKGKRNCFAFWMRKVFLKGLSSVAPWKKLY